MSHGGEFSPKKVVSVKGNVSEWDYLSKPQIVKQMSYSEFVKQNSTQITYEIPLKIECNVDGRLSDEVIKEAIITALENQTTTAVIEPKSNVKRKEKKVYEFTFKIL